MSVLSSAVGTSDPLFRGYSPALERRLSTLQAHLTGSGTSSSSASGMASEEDKAHAAAAAGAPQAADEGAPTIFDKIISKEIASKIVFEDDSVLAFRDISPQGPVHIILIPKVRDGLTQLSKAEDRHEQVLGHLLVVAAKVARQEKLEQGFRLVINDGPHGSQSVYHLHLHLIGGRQMKWPPG